LSGLVGALLSNVTFTIAVVACYNLGRCAGGSDVTGLTAVVACLWLSNDWLGAFAGSMLWRFAVVAERDLAIGTAASNMTDFTTSVAATFERHPSCSSSMCLFLRIYVSLCS